MKYAKLYNQKTTPQSQPIPGAGQVPNSAGGHVWAIDRWAMLDRFLILGSEGGTFYATAPKLTMENAENVRELIAADGMRVVRTIVEVSHSGRAPRNDPAIFALALVASFGDERSRAEAFKALPGVCRTGTHLFAFAEACDGLRGWGRGLRRAIGGWYNAKSPKELEYQLLKYQARNGWSNRDLLRLAHPVPASDEHKALYKWVVHGEMDAPMARIAAMEQLKDVRDAQKAADIVREHHLPREALPTEMLNTPIVWEALLESMPMTAMVRNLATMTKIGLLTAGSRAVDRVVSELGNLDKVRASRLHPMTILVAQRTYASGRGLRGQGKWIPVPSIIDALDSAFYSAFANVEPAGKRLLLGIDVSGSMEWGTVAGGALCPAEVAAAMAMVTVASEKAVTTMAFSTEMREFALSKRARLADVLRQTKEIAMGGTDCALPMLVAAKRGIPVDVFVIYTDNETWYGKVHPAQALIHYRNAMGIAAKLIVVGITATQFSIADPRDAGMLDVVGFDTTTPAAISAFAGA